MTKKKLVDMVFMKPDEIREVKKDIAEMERMLREDQSSKIPKISEPHLVKEEIRKKQQLLKDHTPRKLTGQNANKAYAYAKRLRTYIQEQMPTKRDFYRPYPKTSDGHDFDFERTVAQQVAFQTNPKLKKAVKAYKAIMQCLDPQNPNISNIEQLRR